MKLKRRFIGTMSTLVRKKIQRFVQYAQLHMLHANFPLARKYNPENIQSIQSTICLKSRFDAVLRYG